MNKFTATEFSKIVEMALDNEDPFTAIQQEYYLSERQVITLMKAYLLPNKFEQWKMHISDVENNTNK